MPLDRQLPQSCSKQSRPRQSNSRSIERMSAQDAETEVESLVDALCNYCLSSELSFGTMQEMIQRIPPSEFKGLPVLHDACRNHSVTHDIFQLLLDKYPAAASEWYSHWGSNGTEGYPIHWACYNEDCPDSVIKLLAKKNPSALREFGMVVECGGDFDLNNKGLPLHCYFLRKSNIRLEMVITLVEAHPEALTTADEETGFTPLHTFLANRRSAETDVLRYLIETNPDCLDMSSDFGTPLHVACTNKWMAPATISLLIGHWAESTQQRDDDGFLPIHHHCGNNLLDESASMEILDLLVESYPNSVQDMNNAFGLLPIHVAAQGNSLAFCKRLIGMHPESEGTRDGSGDLPIHCACRGGRLETVKHLLSLCPERFNSAGGSGHLPIHSAALHCRAKVIEHLLICNPDCASKATPLDGSLPLHLVCGRTNGNNADAVDAVQLLFDIHPDAIFATDDGQQTPLDVARSTLRERERWSSPEVFSSVVVFLEGGLEHARQAQDSEAMRALDDNGLLPLHRALRRNVPLGSIKLLLRGNPSALGVADTARSLPIHIACRSSTVKVVKFLVEQDDQGLEVPDSNGNLPLHCASRGGNCGVVKYLVERHAPAVMKRNVHEKLPLHLLCEAGGGRMDSPEYLEAVWILIRAYPDSLTG